MTSTTTPSPAPPPAAPRGRPGDPSPGAPGTSGAVVRVRGLAKRYGAKQAVDGLDLDLATGEIVAVLGPNGAGKTTTIEILEGFRDRDSGEVRVLGEDPARGGRAWRARLGVVAQDSRDQAELTVAESVRSTARYFPAPRDPDEVVEAVGLAPQASARVRSLSGGQRRRLDVALGVVGHPELLFLDEPTTGFDPQARRTFWDLVLRLRDAGTTILLTTHDLAEAAHLADRVAVVRDGRVVAEGTPEALGGPDARTPRVTWTADGVPHAERTDAPTAFAAHLMATVAGADGEVADLCITRPSLEDVYLGLLTSEDDR
ncbi:ABC transporter ATP-binding protein [Isoptericola sp. QY 916]|uniref:ABC transporter ATP-binding protein n=1 Tax=Isoptericola sp. QY 916 TaxID=2782570 RepID=UPI003D2FC76D|nr:ABC transporter ATP-binding protein [Isoptericola sp. QY 916]